MHCGKLREADLLGTYKNELKLEEVLFKTYKVLGAEPENRTNWRAKHKVLE